MVHRFADLGTTATFLILHDQRANQDNDDRLTKERVAEMRQTFAKGPIDRNRSKRIADSRRREAGLADLRRALDFINLHGIKRKQNEDGSYEPLEDGTSSQ